MAKQLIFKRKNDKWLIFSLFFASQVVQAAVQTSNSQSFYEITGNSVSELRLAMNNAGILDQGQQEWGYTKWSVNYHYHYAQDGSPCAFSQFDVELSINTQLPHWVDEDNADPELKSKWDLFLNNLILHEQGHADHGISAANEIYNMLSNLGSMQTCSVLMQFANDHAQAILSKYRKLDVDYDASTQHGIKQGAVF